MAQRIRLTEEARAQLRLSAPAELARQRTQDVLPPVVRVYVPRKTFQPSPQQQAFFDWVSLGTGSAIVEAVAGAGKTTTLVQALKRMDGQVFFGAYNKKIADEIKVKAAEARADRPGVFISTMHGAGFNNWRRVAAHVRVDDRKVRELTVELLKQKLPSDASPQTFASLELFVPRMVAFGKQYLFGVKKAMDDRAAWLELVEHFGADDSLVGMGVVEALDYVIAVFKKSAEKCYEVIDFDDMIFAPIYYNARVFQNDWVLVDECQDLNPARLELARRMLRKGGRLVAVGDSRQAIYGFTGAQADSVEQIARTFNCVRLPLTVTYRCPKKVVEFVHQWVSHIEAHSSAPDGEVRTIEHSKDAPWYLGAEAPRVTDAILCRYTKPLISTAFSLLRNGIACKVEGRDIGNGLIKLATRWRVKTLDRLSEKLGAYYEAQRAKIELRKGSTTTLEDTAQTLQLFISRCQTKGLHSLDDLIKDIQDIFADEAKGVVTLSTGHKAKGREWPRVYWLWSSKQIPNLKDWELEQETNIKYVIGTRAKEQLLIVPELKEPQ